MATLTELIKELREATGAGVLDCKKALEAAEGDVQKATEALRKKGLSKAAKKASRTTADGRVETYVHPGDKLGVMIEVNCETDFVARTDDFKALCHELAMQVAASSPQWVSREAVPADVVAKESEIYKAQVPAGKPDHIVERIIEGKMGKFYGENCLMEQAYIRDDEKTISQLVTETIAKLGENIVIKRFARFQIG